MEKKFRTCAAAYVLNSRQGNKTRIAAPDRNVPLMRILDQPMTNSKKLVISHESHEVTIVRPIRTTHRGFCGDCAEETELLTLDESVSATQMPAREIMRLVELGVVHSIETARGHILICRSSLAKNI